MNIFIDEDIEISGEATLSRGNVQNSQMKIQWCYSPQGACNGTLSESNVDVDWDGLHTRSILMHQSLICLMVNGI